MKGLRIAFSFLTVIPVPGAHREISAKEAGRSSVFFPVVGCVQGTLLYLSYLLLIKIFPHDLSVGLMVAFHVFVNGGFHLDGLSDTADAIASRADRERMLEIMKNSTSGPVGIVVIVLVLLIKYLALKNVLLLDMHKVIPLVMFPVMGKWASVLSMYQGRSASGDGLGKMFIDNTGFIEMALSSFIVMMIVLTVMLAGYGQTADVHQVSLFLVPLGVIWFSSIVFVLYFRRKFKGMTGDTIGAVIEASEVLFLLGMLAVYTK